MTKPARPTAADIVIVDDAPDNLQLLVDLLTAHGYRVRPFAQGAAALRAMLARRPALVLLDITMPGIDGYEICRRLHTDARTKDLPVVFISAAEDVDGKVKAFACGGVDYVTKPFQPTEVLARIGLHLELARHRLALAESYQELKKLEETRDAFTHMVAHDIRSPLWSIEVALSAALEALTGREASVRKTLEGARGAAGEALGMINTMLELSRIQSGRLPLRREEFDLAELARDVAKELATRTPRRRIAVATTTALQIHADRDAVKRVLANLMENACKFTRESGRIDVRWFTGGGNVRVEVEDDGCGIPAPDLPRLLAGIATATASAAESPPGFGLGLAFVSTAVTAHGGEVGAISRVGEGSTFWFTLPLAPPTPE